ncbi:glyoxylate/hydroxypyruvate reductase A [Alcaligenaceae bacterium]|nr:glyoxylate/hydroxypyruvate reductase A [Alcaligenaceae bacterium]
MKRTRPRIYFYSRLDLAAVWREALVAELGDNFDFIVGPHCDTPGDMDVGVMYSLPPDGLVEFCNLRAIVSLSAGINQFDRARMPLGVPLARSVDDSLAEHIVAYAKTAVYRYHRRFHRYEVASRESAWKYELPRLNRETAVGILGLGELGTAVADALVTDGFEVHGWSRTARELSNIQTYNGAAGLSQLVGAVDILINLLPLTAETRGILSSDLFTHFRPGAFLINMGRGDHLIEADLLTAIGQGRIEAATLDVMSVEPLPTDHPFWGHPGILITPHVAGILTPATAAPQVAENVRRAMRGEPLINQIDFDKGY